MNALIAIVGCGPAGSATALELLNLGVDPGDILMLDRATFPRPKLCGGGVTWRGTQTLIELLGAQPTGGSATQGLVLSCEHVGSLTIREPGPQWLYDRAHIDNLLLEACRARGIRILEATPLTDFHERVDGWELKAGHSTLRSRWLVGADGAGGSVRRLAGLSGGHTGRLVEAVYEPVGHEPDPDWLQFSFDPLLENIRGYGWIFPYPLPDGQMYWKLGIMDGVGKTPGKALRDWTARFAQRSGFRMLDDRIHGWPERYFSRHARAHRPGLILVGESWGIDALLGEGIAPSLAMGRYGARRLREVLDNGRFVIGDYEKRFLFTEEGWNLYFHEFLAQRLYGQGSLRWLNVLLNSPRLRDLGATGRAAYGRLARNWRPMLAALGGHVLRHGLPLPDLPDSAHAPA
ncbi:MAG: NAD(P)/FAD-dependent oxidoreductase [Candidatus Dadabacteria bacterium]|nr:MAG: NAD(P)/FAD-dependent oxidoreductase [Candidatus Dadabacteria bacterium]